MDNNFPSNESQQRKPPTPKRKYYVLSGLLVASLSLMFYSFAYVAQRGGDTLIFAWIIHLIGYPAVITTVDLNPGDTITDQSVRVESNTVVSALYSINYKKEFGELGFPGIYGPYTEKLTVVGKKVGQFVPKDSILLDLQLESTYRYFK